eukprot:scaffold8485_cov277-Pinguiococcus_pyrenoidosus.AAC.5
MARGLLAFAVVRIHSDVGDLLQALRLLQRDPKVLPNLGRNAVPEGVDVRGDHLVGQIQPVILPRGHGLYALYLPHEVRREVLVPRDAKRDPRPRDLLLRHHVQLVEELRRAVVHTHLGGDGAARRLDLGHAKVVPRGPDRDGSVAGQEELQHGRAPEEHVQQLVLVDAKARVDEQIILLHGFRPLGEDLDVAANRARLVSADAQLLRLAPDQLGVRDEDVVQRAGARLEMPSDDEHGKAELVGRLCGALVEGLECLVAAPLAEGLGLEAAVVPAEVISEGSHRGHAAAVAADHHPAAVVPKLRGHEQAAVSHGHLGALAAALRRLLPQHMALHPGAHGVAVQGHVVPVRQRLGQLAVAALRLDPQRAEVRLRVQRGQLHLICCVTVVVQRANDPGPVVLIEGGRCGQRRRCRHQPPSHYRRG